VGEKFDRGKEVLMASDNDCHERVKANADALAAMLGLAGDLRRRNLAKLSFTADDWNAAISRVLEASEARPGDDAATADAIHRAHKVARRLGASGEARFASWSVGRDPESSYEGRRFAVDVSLALERLDALLALLTNE
jgi:hypothetical protein